MISGVKLCGEHPITERDHTLQVTGGLVTVLKQDNLLVRTLPSKGTKQRVQNPWGFLDSDSGDN